MHIQSLRVLLFTISFLLPTLPLLGADTVTELVSVSTEGMQGNYISNSASVSNDGLYVAFTSFSSNFVTNDSNLFEGDIFVRDRKNRTLSITSINSNGIQGNKASLAPSLSTSGRYVAFHSYATNLVLDDTNNVADIFVHDRQTGKTTRVSIGPNGTEGNQRSLFPSMSADGRYVVFKSSANNLVLNDTNNADDIFVHDRQSGVTYRISTDSNGVQSNGDSRTATISSDGRYVVFESYATNLVENDTNGVVDIFIHDRQIGTTSRVSISSDGIEGNDISLFPSISSEGRFVAFTSLADNLVNNDTNKNEDTFVRDIENGSTMRVSVNSIGQETFAPFSGCYYRPFISGDGQYVAFVSSALNLVENDNNDKMDIFIKNMADGAVTRIDFGNGQNGCATESQVLNGMTSDGNFILFTSNSTDLVTEDTNHEVDVFIYGPLVSHQPNQLKFIPAISKLLLHSPPMP